MRLLLKLQGKMHVEVLKLAFCSSAAMLTVIIYHKIKCLLRYLAKNLLHNTRDRVSLIHMADILFCFDCVF
jgi:hypothetical protein